MDAKKPVIYKLHMKATAFRKKERFWATIEGLNGETVFTSEKYVNRADAVQAIKLVAGKVPEVLPVIEE
jgi:uncharacterized protein YegP (UPF0339 family)